MTAGSIAESQTCFQRTGSLQAEIGRLILMHKHFNVIQN